MSNRQRSLTFIQARVTSAIAGVSKNFSSMAQITLAGVAYTPATLLAILEAYAPLVSALTAAHCQLHAAVLAERAQREQVIMILRALAAYAATLYGPDPIKLGDFGFSPGKPLGVESAATRAVSVAKAKATREAKKAALAAASSPAAPEVPPAGSTTPKS